MGRRPQQPLRPLIAEEQDALERLVKARSGRRNQVQRASAVRATAQGHSSKEAARQAG